MSERALRAAEQHGPPRHLGDPTDLAALVGGSGDHGPADVPVWAATASIELPRSAFERFVVAIPLFLVGALVFMSGIAQPVSLGLAVFLWIWAVATLVVEHDWDGRHLRLKVFGRPFRLVKVDPAAVLSVPRMSGLLGRSLVIAAPDIDEPVVMRGRSLVTSVRDTIVPLIWVPDRTAQLWADLLAVDYERY